MQITRKIMKEAQLPVDEQSKKELWYNKSMTEYPDTLIDYCIENKVTIEDGLCQMIEEKLNVVDTGLKTLKKEVVDTINAAAKPVDVSKEDIDLVQDFLKYLEHYNNGSDEK